MSEAVKKKPRFQAVKPIPAEAFNSQQISLFQKFLTNTNNERDALSNAIDLWDSIPRYALSRKKQEEMRLPGGYLPILKIGFQYRAKSYTVQIRPARIEDRNKYGKITGATIEYYPSAREELIEHALRKLAAEQYAGYFDKSDYRSGVAFTLYRLRQELATQGHTMTYEGLAEGLEIMHYSQISITDKDCESENQILVSQSYLPALVKVNKSERAADPEAKWIVQFHGLVSKSINQITYRQFNYQRLMKCNTQLARWLISQLVLKYTQASPLNKFEMRFSTIKRDSYLLNGYNRTRDAISALNKAWQELQVLEVINGFTKTNLYGPHKKLEDVIYILHPSRNLVSEQKAANSRLNKDKSTTIPLLEHPTDKENCTVLGKTLKRS